MVSEDADAAGAGARPQVAVREAFPLTLGEGR